MVSQSAAPRDSAIATLDHVSRSSPDDRVIAALAADQHGVVSRGQLRQLGLSTRGIHHRVTAGRLHELFPGAYAVGHPRVVVDGRRLAAVLACGDGAVLSRRSAATAWGMLRGDRRRIDVVAPGRSGGRLGDRPGIDLRRTRCLPPDDVTVLRELPITTVGRTLLDLAGVVPRQVLQRAVHEAEVLEILDVDAALATIERNPGRRGTRVLRQALGITAPDPANGVFAERFLALCVAHDLPTPRLGIHLDGGDRLYEVDALFSAEAVIVELDGRRVHSSTRHFQADRRRDSVFAARGYQTLRYTWRRLEDEPAAVAAELRSVLALRTRRAP
jgi:hypothetical protein